MSAINQHFDSLIKDGEVDPATVKQYLIVQKEGSRQVQRKVDHYNLQVQTVKLIELNDFTHDSFRRKHRDQYLQKVCEAAGIELEFVR